MPPVVALASWNSLFTSLLVWRNFSSIFRSRA
jgi:hypothetical protein